MSNNKIEIYKTCYCFSVKKDELDKYESSKVLLPDNSWSIKINKRTIHEDEVIDLHLMCLPLNGQSPADPPNWICEADATVTLRSNKFGEKSYKKMLLSIKFTNRHLCETFSDFIKWSKLEEYSQNGLLVFDVSLLVKPTRYVAGEVEQLRSVFRFTVDDVSTPVEVWSKLSPDVIVRGTTFYADVRKGDLKLQIYLYHKMDSRNQNWSWDAKCLFKLMSFDAKVPPIERKFNKIFDSATEGWGFVDFLAWAEFIDPSKKFIKNGQAVFEIDLEVAPPKSILSSDQNPSNPSGTKLECSICLHNVIGREPTTTNCGHLFCSDCINRSIRQRPKCPACNADVKSMDLRRMYI